MTLALTTVEALRETLRPWRANGDSIAFVPTMGALHAGHLALVAEARQQAKRVVVSIFVNPTQFGPHEDFDQYPRPIENDLALLREAAADLAWCPAVEEMYPEGFNTSIHVAGISDVLDGAARPGHFDGVATVVTKLFMQVQPDIALFGEKDYQQLCVLKKLVADLNMPVTIIGVPTVREQDGLALSSRNQYLSEAQRPIATKLNQVLRHSAFVIREEGRPVLETIEKAERFLLDAGFASIDYVAYVDAVTLTPLTHYQPGSRLLIAARLGTTRLIDNVKVDK